MWEVEFFAEYLEEFRILTPDVQAAILEKSRIAATAGPNPWTSYG